MVVEVQEVAVGPPLMDVEVQYYVGCWTEDVEVQSWTFEDIINTKTSFKDVPDYS